MKPIKTEACNKVFKAPAGMDNCVDLHVYHEYGPNVVAGNISWWKPTFKERVAILFGRNIRLTILGVGHPPVMVEADPDKMKEIV